jgi:23S rRNA pseudouridine1911/1915/1917 synthase
LSEQTFSFQVEVSGERLDKYLSQLLKDESRARVQRFIEEGFVRVGEMVITKPALRLSHGDLVRVTIPPLPPLDVEPEAIPLDVLLETEDVLVINKPAGLVVHPAVGHLTGTLVSAVLNFAPEVRDAGEAERPGIVHRLDKDTSGLILVAKNAATQRALQASFANREVEKTYLAIVSAHPPTPEGRIEAPIGRDPSHRQRMGVVPLSRGREAVTLYQTLERFNDYALLEAKPLTGRTHQIRVHLAFIKCPVAGDLVYGKRTTQDRVPLPRQMLHAWKIKITLPGEKEPRLLEAPILDDFQAALDALRMMD